MAQQAWVRVVANLGLGAYEVYEATGSLSEPDWPEVDFQEILRIGFRDRFIISLDDPILLRLRGEM